MERCEYVLVYHDDDRYLYMLTSEPRLLDWAYTKLEKFLVKPYRDVWDFRDEKDLAGVPYQGTFHLAKRNEREARMWIVSELCHQGWELFQVTPKPGEIPWYRQSFFLRKRIPSGDAGQAGREQPDDSHAGAEG